MSWLDTQAWVGVVSAVVSVVALGLNVRVAGRSTAIQRFEVRERYFEDVHGWAAEAVASIARAVALCRDQEDAATRGAELRATAATLSALVDRGRWFFPNLVGDGKGKEKELAFQGHRQDVLNHLMAALGAVESLRHDGGAAREEAEQRLVTARRGFVSEVQRVLDPRARASEYAQIMAT